MLRTRCQLSEAQVRVIERRLRYAEQAATRLGRVDWLNAFVGSLTGIIMDTAIHTGAAKELFRFGGQVVTHLFGGGMPELPFPLS